MVAVLTGRGHLCDLRHLPQVSPVRLVGAANHMTALIGVAGSFK